MELTNREISLLFWGGLFVAWALSVPGVRKGLGPMLRSLLTPVISVPIVMMIGYVAGIVVTLYRIGLWTPADTKDTILWGIGFAAVTFFETPQITRDPSRLKTVVVELFGLAVVIEFMIDHFVMRLWLELLLVPFAVMVTVLLVVAERSEEHARVARVLQIMQGILGLSLAVFVISQLVSRFSEVASVDTVKDFALPIILSVLFVPFLYLMALYAGYDEVLRRLGWTIRDRAVRRYARRRTVVLCNVKLGTLATWSKAIARLRFDSKASVDSAVTDFRARSRAA